MSVLILENYFTFAIMKSTKACGKYSGSTEAINPLPALFTIAYSPVLLRFFNSKTQFYNLNTDT